jgi:enterochelin esterase-like enzyme
MKAKHLLIVTFFQLVFVLSIQAEKFRVQENLHFNSTLLKQEVAYSIILPVDYFSSGKSYPVIYFLHGLGDNESSWLEYGQISQYMDRMVNAGTIAPFICVMPQGFRSYYSNFYDGSFPYQDMFVKELVPFIDKKYRTQATAKKRGVMGYSMGGFGALVLPIKYPNTFRVSIPLSASIRTDKQYADEDQKGWDQQWGKIFGAEGKSGSDRINSYYLQNSPYHLIKSLKTDDLKQIAFFIENGDKENTLCRSNEELHMLMLKQSIPHIYNVRDGGHDFKFWQESIPEAFRFASCYFKNKLYSTVIKSNTVDRNNTNKLWSKEISIPSGKASVYFPENPESANRLYPTIYFVSDLKKNDQNRIMSLYQKELRKGSATPVVFCFLYPLAKNALLDETIQYLEKHKISREGRRFRAIWNYGVNGASTLEQALTKDKFTACVFTSSNIALDESEIEKLITTHESTRDNIRWYIDTPPSGETYFGNGYLHINLKEHDFAHEYRVRNQYQNDFSFLLSGFKPAINFISKRFHY